MFRYVDFSYIPPCEDGEVHGFHGRIFHIPADEYAVFIGRNEIDNLCHHQRESVGKSRREKMRGLSDTTSGEIGSELW